MKKGCFIKFIVILTIVVAAILYLIQTKFDDWVLKPGKKVIERSFEEKWNNDLSFVRQSPEKDSVKLLIENYISKLKLDQISRKQLDNLKDIIEGCIEDSVIDKSDLIKIKKILRVKQ